MPTRVPKRFVVALALCLAPLAAQAQRYTVGLAGLYGQPLGDFGQNVRRGFGLDGFGTIALDPQGIVSLRADLGYIRYNRKSEPFLANTGFGYVELESETTSGVLTFGGGLQLTAPTTGVRPYVGASGGFARFATNTSINVPANYSNTGQKETLDQQTVSSDFIFSLGLSGGLQFELGFLGRGVLGDLGVRYHRNGQAEYVSSSGVTYNGNGTATITPTRSEADFMVYRLGIVIPLGGGNMTVRP